MSCTGPSSLRVSSPGSYWHSNICPSSAVSSAGETPAPHTQLPTDVPVWEAGAPSLLPSLPPCQHKAASRTRRFQSFPFQQSRSTAGKCPGCFMLGARGRELQSTALCAPCWSSAGFPRARSAWQELCVPQAAAHRAGWGSPSAVTPWGRAGCASPWSSSGKQKCSSSQGLPTSRCQVLRGSSPGGITSPGRPQKEPDAKLSGAGSTARGWTGPGNSPRWMNGRTRQSCAQRWALLQLRCLLLGPDGSSAPPSCCSQGAAPARPSGFPARLSPTRNCRLAASFPPLLLCQSLPPVAKPPRPSPHIPPVPFCFPLADSPTTLLLPSTSPQHCVQYPTSTSS